MNKLILCEGETDAILLSYYLERAAGWIHSKKAPANLDIKAVNQNETAAWYRHADDYLLISAVGGKDNFAGFFESRIKPPLFAANAFEKIAVVTDRDNRDISEIEASIEKAFSGLNVDVHNNSWTSGTYQDAYTRIKELKVLLVVVPNEHQGALETLMLDAISEDPYDKNIVDLAGDFVRQMRAEAERYILSDRLELKAHLGVTWAVQYPEKVFSLIDEQIKNVKWEESDILAECFSKLIEI